MSPPRKSLIKTVPTREAVFQAAATLFSEKGFDGVSMDDIARLAAVNKAMIYYHFASKAGLYNAVLRDTFSAIEDAVRGVREAGGTPEAQVRAYVEAIAGIADQRPFFPSIWLREVADAGRHLDPAIAQHFRGVLAMLGGILHEGAAAGTMRDVHPFLVQLGIVGPLTLFIASRPLREKFAQVSKTRSMDVSIDAVIEHVQRMVLGGVAGKTTKRNKR